MEQLFLLLYIPFVLAMMLVMPVGGPPDEQAHLRQAWLLSTGQIGTETCTYPENLRAILADSTGGTENSVMKGEEFLTARLSEETVTDKGNEATGIYPQVSYLPQSLMMFLTRLFTDRISLLLYSARIGSMLVTGILFFFASGFQNHTETAFFCACTAIKSSGSQQKCQLKNFVSGKACFWN